MEGECAGHVVKGEVELSHRAVNCVVLETSKKFLDVANTDRTASWTLESVVAGEVNVHRVLVSLPFLNSKQSAESRVAKGNSLVGAKRLCVVCVRHGPVKARGEWAKTSSSICKVYTSPLSSSVGTSGVGISIRVVAVVVTCKSVVPYASGSLNYQFQSGVVLPLKTKESSQEILGGLSHTSLSSATSNNLGAIIGIQMTVHVLVEHSRVKELLLSNRDKNLGTELVGPVIEERQLASVIGLASHVGMLCSKLSSTRASGRVARAVSRQHVQLNNLSTSRKLVFVDTETIRVREVVAQLAHHLEDIAVVGIASNRDLSFQRTIGNIAGAKERCSIGLSQESRFTSRCRAFNKSAFVVHNRT